MIEGAGFQYELSGLVDKIPEYDPRSGDHYWIVSIMYKVDPTIWQSDSKVLFDQENLVLTAGPGCFFCEQPYSKYLATRRCKGNP